MKNFDFNFIFVLIFFNLIFEDYCYEIPAPTFELTSENNILATVKGEDDLEFLIFHGNINHNIQTFQPGEYNIALTKNSDNNWSFELINNFNDSDILYYWLYAQYNQEKYWLSYKKFKLQTLLRKSFDENITLPPEQCPPTITTITGTKKQICKGQLIFEETFDTYNKTKWQREIKFSGYDGEFVLYENKEQNLYIKDGKLHIVPTLTTETEKIFGTNIDLVSDKRCTEDKQIEFFCKRNAEFRILPPITSAKIRTKNSFSFRYGRIDIRARLPKGDWIFPQLFLEPLKNEFDSDRDQEYLDGQMRIAFIHSNEKLNEESKYYDGSILNGGIFLEKYATNSRVDLLETKFSYFTKESGAHLGNDFHVYSIEWTDSEIILYFDNTSYGEFDNRISRRVKTPYHEPFYISLGVGVGGYKNFPDNTYTMNGIEKPWQNDDPNAETNFWFAYDKWIKTWNDKHHELIIDYITVKAV